MCHWLELKPYMVIPLLLGSLLLERIESQVEALVWLTLALTVTLKFQHYWCQHVVKHVAS